MVWWKCRSRSSPSILQRSKSLGGGIGRYQRNELATMEEREIWASSSAGGRWRGIYTPPEILAVAHRLTQFSLRPEVPVGPELPVEAGTSVQELPDPQKSD